jgi:2-hydroxychromene-2-carboxylate isomerase
MNRASFYFDVGSPYAYLAAERLQDTLGERALWQPVSLGALFKLNGRSSWAASEGERRQTGMAEVERRANLYGLPPLCWPEPWPGNYLMAMRAATYAFQVGCGYEFTMHAFRGAFQQGNDISVPAQVLAAAEAAGLNPSEVERATQDPQIKLALREATDEAHELGVFGVPTVAIEGELFWGDDRLADAAVQLERSR